MTWDQIHGNRVVRPRGDGVSIPGGSNDSEFCGTIEDRLAGIKMWLEFARTPGLESRPPQSETELVAYLERLHEFVGRLLPDVDWLIAELGRRLREELG